MAFNLLDSVRSYLTPDLIDKASSHLGENNNNISRALSAAVPALLGLFINRSERGDSQGLLADAREAAEGNAFRHPQNLFSGGMGPVVSNGINWLRNTFGDAGNNVVSAISDYAGIKSDSARGLFGMLAPVGLGVLGRHAQEANLSPQGLNAYLADQKPSVMNALPTGMNLGFLFADGPRAEHAASAHHVSETRRTETVHEEKRTNWLPWLLLALGAIALIYFLTRSNGDDDVSLTGADTTAVTTTTTDTGAAATTPVATVPVRETTRVQLAGDTAINAFRGGVEDQLVTCLNDAACTPGTERWFDFDNINFETGSARLTDSSQVQVQNIAAILKAYPKAKIKIGGYTDSTGNAADNKRLSQQRADAVLNAIKAAGANAAQLVGAEGYGSEFAKMPATASDEERKTDRRIAVQLREK
ncbi:OmpA family protein [Flavisolibacter sp. BT320]|nr:OmpA family protein [Flavisolibacter longurius]